MRISDWSSDVCSSDLLHQVRGRAVHLARVADQAELRIPALARLDHLDERGGRGDVRPFERAGDDPRLGIVGQDAAVPYPERSEEHTSELQSLMRNSYAVFCLKKKKQHNKESKIDNKKTLEPLNNPNRYT